MPIEQKFKFVEEFLNTERVKELIEEERLDDVYRLLLQETSLDPYYLTRYLLSLDIQPLDYMTVIFDEMFSRIYREEPTRLYIPEKIKLIKDYAFYKCTELVEVTIPASVRELGFGAFFGCTGLTRITIHNPNIILDDDVFYGCEVSVRVPRGAKCIKYLQDHNVNYIEV